MSTKTKAKIPQLECLRWCGAMGHRYAIIRKSEQWSCGWDSYIECNEIDSKEIGPDCEAWEQVSRGKWRKVEA